jgi:hypothetical protein
MSVQVQYICRFRLCVYTGELWVVCNKVEEELSLLKIHRQKRQTTTTTTTKKKRQQTTMRECGNDNVVQQQQRHTRKQLK